MIFRYFSLFFELLRVFFALFRYFPLFDVQFWPPRGVKIAKKGFPGRAGRGRGASEPHITEPEGRVAKDG
jgi:hypothetical protein